MPKAQWTKGQKFDYKARHTEVGELSIFQPSAKKHQQARVRTWSLDEKSCQFECQMRFTCVRVCEIQLTNMQTKKGVPLSCLTTSLSLAGIQRACQETRGSQRSRGRCLKSNILLFLQLCFSSSTLSLAKFICDLRRKGVVLLWKVLAQNSKGFRKGKLRDQVILLQEACGCQWRFVNLIQTPEFPLFGSHSHVT